MLKNISSLGTVLNKTEQKSIEGGIKLISVIVCTANTIGWDCGPPHCPGVCSTNYNGDPYCLSY